MHITLTYGNISNFYQSCKQKYRTMLKEMLFFFFTRSRYSYSVTLNFPLIMLGNKLLCLALLLFFVVFDLGIIIFAEYTQSTVAGQSVFKEIRNTHKIIILCIFFWSSNLHKFCEVLDVRIWHFAQWTDFHRKCQLSKCLILACLPAYLLKYIWFWIAEETIPVITSAS